MISPQRHDQDSRLAVFDWMEKYAEREPDWTDGRLAVLASTMRDAKVWTYDGEFRTTWRKPNGGVISLA